MDAPLKVTSACYVSDVTDHTAPMVFAILKQISLLCGPISPVVNLEMSSTVRFYDGNAIYGCSGLGNCRMLKKLSGAFFLIGLISMLIR